MKPAVLPYDDAAETWSDEGCFINELSNRDVDPSVSVAQARVTPGVTTEAHRLDGIVERYVILSGEGSVDVEGLDRADVGPGDVVVIPAGASQPISNTGTDDLVFLCVCTPRFEQRRYRRVVAS